MAELIVGVVGNLLRHVTIEVRQRCHVGRIAAVDSTELVVLLPQIALDQLYRGEEPQDRDVAPRQSARLGHRAAREQRAPRYRRRAGEP